jgi:hypothetical protein
VDAVIKGRINVEGTPRYGARYYLDDGPRNLAGWYTAVGVHPQDIELREVEPTPDPEESPLSDAAEQAAISAAEMQVAAILDTLTKSGIPRPHKGATPAEWIGHLVRMFEDQSNAVTQVRAALLPVVDDGSMTIDSVAREAAERYQAQRHAANPHLVNAQSTALREVQELAVKCGGDERLETIGLLRSAFGATEKRGYDVGRNQTLQDVHRLLLRYAVPMRRVVPVENVLDLLEKALRERDERVREVTDLARRLTGLGAPPTDTVDSMITFVIAQARAEARSNATAHAEQAASAKIRKLEKTIHDAFQYLNDQIPGIEGLTLDQKLREVVCDLRNKLAFAELHRGRLVVIAGVDQVRAVVQRAIEDGPVELDLINDLGGWFLRALAAANLAVIRHDWDGVDPTAEPVEPTIKVEQANLGGRTGKAAPPVFAEVEKIFAEAREVLKPALDEWARLWGKP